MLNKHNLTIANLAEKNASNYALQGILIESKRTVAADSYCAIIVETNKIPAKQFPQTQGCTPTDEFKPFILPRADALAIAKALPSKSIIPVLRTAAVGSESDVDGTATIAVNNLESAQVFHPRKTDMKFPNVDLCFPKESDTKLEIGLDLDVLVPLLKTLQSMVKESSGCRAVKFSFIDPESAVRIDCTSDDEQKITALVMPYKLV